MAINDIIGVSEMFFNANDDSFGSMASDSGSSTFIHLSEFLVSQFSDVPNNFNVVHINAQSIPAHFPDMLTTFNCNHIHAVLISESWLKPYLPSTCYNLPGFQLIRNDRLVGGGGGVAIYLRSHIPFTIVDMSAQPPPLNAGEHLFIEVTLSHSKVLLGVYYCPSMRIDFFNSFQNIIDKLTPSYSHTIIMGDFNTCLLKQDTRASSLQSIVYSSNLSILPLNATHHFPNSNPSLLDLILVSSCNFVTKHGQYAADVFSYHDLIFLSYNTRSPKFKPKILLQRNFGGMDIDSLRKDALLWDWSNLFNADNLDSKVSIFTSALIKIYDVHAPVRAVKIKHRPSPWLTDDIKHIINKKAIAKAKYKRNPNAFNREKYINIRNHCNKVCRDAQRLHIHKSVENGDTAKVWKFLRSLGVGKSKNTPTTNDLNVNLLNKHFSSSSCLDSTAKANTLTFLSTIPTPNHSSFIFKPFTACGVEKSVLSITSNAVGSDCVSRNMILPILDIILPIICHILNFSISTSSFPSSWKNAEVIPIPKKINPASFSEYRPISLLPFLSKVLERLVYIQFNSFLCANSLLNPFQSGFRPGHSTTTALVNITDDIRLGMERGEVTVLCLLDFSNAFNTVDHDVLLGIMRSLNVSPTAIGWFQSYLSGRQQRIRIDDTLSSWCNVCVGVPQGGVLSPLLFAVFINSISNNLTSSYHLYADDLQIYTKACPNDLPNAINVINADLERILEWSKAYGLHVNPAKSQSIIIGSAQMLNKLSVDHLPQIVFDKTNIPYRDSVKNLGIHIDKNLSWDHQIKEIHRKVYASAASLRRLRNFLPIYTKTALAKSLLFPIFDYADVSYLDLTEAQLDKLERIQNFCIRFIFGLRKYDHVSLFRTKLKWLSIRLHRNAHILHLLYSILFNPSYPSYLKNRFVFLRDSHSRNLRSAESLKLYMPLHTSKFMNKSFTVQAVRLWNELPLAVKRAPSLPVFKKLVKNHYLALRSHTSRLI